jgi:hypothetical protein
MMTGPWFGRATYIAAELAFADVLSDGPCHRKLFVQHAGGWFGLTAIMRTTPRLRATLFDDESAGVADRRGLPDEAHHSRLG